MTELKFDIAPTKFNVGASQQWWHMSRATCEALKLQMEHTSPSEITDAIGSLMAVYEAAKAYDESILGKAARGEAELLPNGGGVLEGQDGDELDKLYMNMANAIAKAKSNIDAVRRIQPAPRTKAAPGGTLRPHGSRFKLKS